MIKLIANLVKAIILGLRNLGSKVPFECDLSYNPVISLRGRIQEVSDLKTLRQKRCVNFGGPQR